MKRIAAFVIVLTLLGGMALSGAAFADNETKPVSDVLQWKNIVQIVAVNNCMLGLRKDGTVVRAGSDEGGYGRTSHLDMVDRWSGVKALVDCGGGLVAGLKSDGTVVSTSGADFSSWRNIVKVVGCKGAWIAGLKADGTVVITKKGEISDLGWEHTTGWIDTSTWRDIVDIVPLDGWSAANGLAGIRANGTVVEQKDGGYKYVDTWDDIVSLCRVLDGTLGIRRDGTLAIPPYDFFDDYFVWTSPPETWTNLASLYSGFQDDVFAVTVDGRVQAATIDEGFRLANAVTTWRDIKTLYPMYARVIGIKNDGTVVYAGDPAVCDTNAMNAWKGIKEISFWSGSSRYYAIGLKTDGTLCIADIGS